MPRGEFAAFPNAYALPTRAMYKQGKKRQARKEEERQAPYFGYGITDGSAVVKEAANLASMGIS